MNKSIPVSIKIKNFTLLVMYICGTRLEIIRQALEEKIKKAPFFLLKNTPIIINVENLDYRSNWNTLYKTISNTGLFIVGVCCCHDNELKKTIINSGLPIFTTSETISKQYKDHSKYLYKNQPVIYKTQLINTPIRSGQKIYARNRDLIVTANVSSGAEIIADGNIHIYGAMRGRVLAGASGNKESQIFCTHLSPELISIGGHYWLNEQIPKEFSGKAAKLSLKNNTLIIQNL